MRSMSAVNLAGVDELRAALDRRELSARELIEESLGRIDALDGELRSFTTVDADGARAAARKADETRGSTDAGKSLLGIPVAVKDNIDVAGLPTTNGSPALAFTPSVDAEAVRRLRAAGAIVIGKTNMHEAAYGATTLNPFFGDCRNPWNAQRIVGGSSGGSAAAVAGGRRPAICRARTPGTAPPPAP